jgi:hypothetical protein
MGWHDAAAVMMRRLIEVAIIEAFEADEDRRQDQGCEWQLFAAIRSCGQGSGRDEVDAIA